MQRSINGIVASGPTPRIAGPWRSGRTGPTVMLDAARATPSYPCEAILADGTAIRLRLIGPDDKAELLAGFGRLTAESRYYRFMGGTASLSPAMLRYFTEIDYVNHFALGALALDHDPALGIGVARFIRRHDNPHVAEPAFTVIDEYQRRGLGHLLFEHLMVAAAARGIREFEAVLLTDNEPMRVLFAHYGAHFRHLEGATLTARMPIRT